MITLPDLTLWYPDRSDENDTTAILSMGSTPEMSINYGFIGRKIAEITKDGVVGAGKIISDLVLEMFEFVREVIPNIDDEWLENLGRDYEPMFGSDSWNRAIAPKGYVDRYKAATETIGLIIALFAARTIGGRIGVGGLVNLAGGQYKSFKQRKFRSEMTEILQELSEESLIDDAQAVSTKDRSLSRDELITSSMASALRALANNNRYAVLRAAKAHDESV